jgi:hypothetical protein
MVIGSEFKWPFPWLIFKVSIHILFLESLRNFSDPKLAGNYVQIRDTKPSCAQYRPKPIAHVFIVAHTL